MVTGNRQNSPTKHLCTHFTWGAGQLSTDEGNLLRKSCHETGSQEPIDDMDFLPWHCLHWGGGGVKERKQTQISQCGGTPTILLLPLPQSTHSLQPATSPFLFPLPCYSFAFPSCLVFVCPRAENSERICALLSARVFVCMCV